MRVQCYHGRNEGNEALLGKRCGGSRKAGRQERIPSVLLSLLCMTKRFTQEALTTGVEVFARGQTQGCISQTLNPGAQRGLHPLVVMFTQVFTGTEVLI